MNPREGFVTTCYPSLWAVFWFTRWPFGYFSRCGLAPSPPSVLIVQSRGTASGPSPTAAPRPFQVPLTGSFHCGDSCIGGVWGRSLSLDTLYFVPLAFHSLILEKTHLHTEERFRLAGHRPAWKLDRAGASGPRRAGRTAPCSLPPARAGHSRPCFL